MPEPAKLEKAQLKEVQLNGNDTVETDFLMYVQFNPESLKVNRTNSITNNDKTNQNKESAVQYTATSTTKLSFDLWFDATVSDEVNDVRDLTKNAAYFMTIKASKKEESKMVPPGVSFVWGSFVFAGIMDSINENLEYFSPEGRPLRASLSISITQQDVVDKPEINSKGPVKQAGAEKLVEVKQDESVQETAVRNGKAKFWALIAEINGIDNARQIPVGTFLDIFYPRK